MTEENQNQEQTQALTKTQQKLEKIQGEFDAIDQAGEQVRELVKTNDGTASKAIKQAAAVQTLRELLSKDVMEPIMALQNNPLGFKTDSRDGYDMPTVRDCVIVALGRGASPTLNEFNIIAANCYLTREYFVRQLNQLLGKQNWYFLHEIPQTHQGQRMVKDKYNNGKYKQITTTVGAEVKTTVYWRSSTKATWKQQELKHFIKGDSYATADSYYGKADRKCGAWLLAQITGEEVPEGDASEDYIDVTPENNQENDQKEKEETAEKEKQNIANQFNGDTASDGEGNTSQEPTAESMSLEQAAELCDVPSALLMQYFATFGFEKWEDVPAQKKQAIIETPEKVKSAISSWADREENDGESTEQEVNAGNPEPQHDNSAEQTTAASKLKQADAAHKLLLPEPILREYVQKALGYQKWSELSTAFKERVLNETKAVKQEISEWREGQKS